jgi:nucleoside 2-deoxyribosyltransferase
VPIVTLCGSGKMRAEIFAAAKLLTDSGIHVLVPPLHRIEELVQGRPAECRELAWKGATFAHLNRIEKADAIFIVNPTGYIGPSTTLELGYAIALRKLIVAMMPDHEELARTVVLDLVLDTTDIEEACTELVKRLNW